MIARIALLLILCALPAGVRAADPPATARLQPGQTLEDLAEQLFEDRNAADELRALNGISPGAPASEGAVLNLPGRDREQALAALRLAGQSMQQAKLDGAEELAEARLRQAADTLQQAEQRRLAADYTAAQRLADEAWATARLARQESLARRADKNRFSVSVDPEGVTRVEVTSGDGVKVTAHKKSTTVGSGQAVQVRHGESPGKAEVLLPPPEPLLPFDSSVLVTPSILFRWKPVEGAGRYVLLISRDARGLQPVRQITTEDAQYLFQSSLSDGAYHFFLRTVDTKGLVGQASAPRRFTLQVSADGGVKIEPGGGREGGT